MAEPASPPQIVAPVETSGRKRKGSEAEGSPDEKRQILAVEEKENINFGYYPYNIKRTCILHDHSADVEDPQGLKCLDFETEFGNYDNNLFIDQNEAEDLLATLEVLAGKLASETQPLPLEYNPIETWNNEPTDLTISSNTSDQSERKHEEDIYSDTGAESSEKRSN